MATAVGSSLGWGGKCEGEMVRLDDGQKRHKGTEQASFPRPFAMNTAVFNG